MKNLLFTLFCFLFSYFAQSQSLCFDPANDNRYETYEQCNDIGVLDVDGDGNLDVIAAGGGLASIHLGNGDGTFEAYNTSLPGTNSDIEMVDFDDDGDLDFYSYASGSLVAGVNNNDGTFAWLGYLAITMDGGNNSEMSVGDVTGDGKLDIVVNDQSTDMIHVAECDNDGIPVSYFSIATIDEPGNIKVGQLNADGMMDIVVSSGTSSNISIHIAEGGETFTTITQFAGVPTGAGYGSIEIANVDGDSDKDILVGGLTSMYVLENNGNETFTSLPDVFMGSYCYGFETGDWDNDGDNDVAWANLNTGGVTINLNNSDGTFPSQGNVFYSSNGNSVEVARGDFNEDGDMDLIVANGFARNFAFLEGNGEGKFGSLSLLAGYGAAGLCAADFDNDSDVDIIATNSNNPSFMALSKNNGDGSFTDTQFLPTVLGAEECVAADFDEDGNMDVAIHSSDGFQIHFGNGNGTFDNYITFESANIGAGGERTICAGDFNGDGNVDMAGSRLAANNVAVVYGDGDGGFSSPDIYENGMDYARTILAAHLNNDTYEDLVICSNVSDEVFVFFGNVTQDLDAPVILDTPGNPEGLSVFDADEDGANDLLVVSPNLNKIYVFIGNNNQTFDAATNFDTPTSSNATRGAHADINGDGNEDFICALYQDDAVGVFFGNGDGTFQSAVSYDVDQAPNRILAADFNNDGAMDFSTLNSGIFNVSVVLNNSAFITADGDLAFCEGEDVALTASEGYSYLWSSGETTQTITTDEAGEYYCAITNQAGTCTLITTTVQVEVYVGQTVTLDLDSTFVCVENGDFFLSGGFPWGGSYTGTGITANNFDPSQSGEGTFTITYTFEDAGECTSGSATDEITVDICSAIEENLLSGFSVYPSVTYSSFIIKGDHAFTFSMMDSFGKLLLDEKETSTQSVVHLEHFSAGLYFTKVTSGNENRIFRVEKLN